MVPISEKAEIGAAVLVTYIAARGLERVRVFQLGVQRLEDRGRVVGRGLGGGREVCTIQSAVAVEIFAGKIHVVHRALG